MVRHVAIGLALLIASRGWPALAGIDTETSANGTPGAANGVTGTKRETDEKHRRVFSDATV